MDQAEYTRLPMFLRSYIYALHGFATEIMFTAVYDCMFHLNKKLLGHTSVLMIPIYAISGLMCEQIHFKCSHWRIPLLLRGLVYLVWMYFWEFTTGFILKQFDLCPWDYTHYAWDFMGLVTLEYAPFWYMFGILIDRFVLPFLFSVYLRPINAQMDNENGLSVDQNEDEVEEEDK